MYTFVEFITEFYRNIKLGVQQTRIKYLNIKMKYLHLVFVTDESKEHPTVN